MTSPALILLISALVLGLGISLVRVHPFIALLLGALVAFLLTSDTLQIAYYLEKGEPLEVARNLAERSLAEKMNAAFGSLAARLGLLIAFASIVATGLFHSGAAQKIIRTLLKGRGEKHAPAAFAVSSFTLGIPAFSDTVLYLMLPLARSAAQRLSGNYLLYVLAIAIAATTAHGFVPPTPGPLFAVAEFKLDLGLYLPLSLVVAAIAVAFGYVVARLISARLHVPIRETPDVSDAEMEALNARKDHELPPLWLSLLPLIIPIGLISFGSIVRASGDSGLFAQIASELGQPMLAMALGAAAAIILMARYGSRDRAAISKKITDSLQSAGLIILITAAGGTFGAALQQTNVGADIAAFTQQFDLSLIILAWLLAAFVGITTGSGTVAVITSVGILVGVVETSDLPYNVGYIALAIGSGSKMLPWMNNSFFWLLCQVGGLTVSEVLRSFTILNSAVGLFGLGLLIVLSTWIPLI